MFYQKNLCSVEVYKLVLFWVSLAEISLQPGNAHDLGPCSWSRALVDQRDCHGRPPLPSLYQRELTGTLWEVEGGIFGNGAFLQRHQVQRSSTARAATFPPATCFPRRRIVMVHWRPVNLDCKKTRRSQNTPDKGNLDPMSPTFSKESKPYWSQQPPQNSATSRSKNGSEWYTSDLQWWWIMNSRAFCLPQHIPTFWVTQGFLIF